MRVRALVPHLGTVGATLVAIAIAALPLTATDAGDPMAAAAMERFLSRPSVPHQYSASRRLEASGSGQRGWLDARTEFAPASGLHVEVHAEGGSGFIRKRVLRSLLEEEQRVIARGETARVALSTDNYQFTPERVNEEGLAIVAIRPLRKEKSLIVGRLFLTMDGDLVRLEGRLAKNPSFWVTRVNVLRTYERIGGVLMPVSLETKAQLRIFGSSALRMTYQYSHIDHRPVAEGLAAK